MGIYRIFFSPTGGTKKALELFTDRWKNVEEIDLTERKDEREFAFGWEDICFFGVPSYGGRVPKTALLRIRKMNGNGASAVLLAAYGNRDYDDTLLELKNELETCGFRVRAAAAAVTEHSIMHEYGTGRPDASDAQELHAFAEKTERALSDGAEQITVPGHQPYREYTGVPLKPSAKKSCIGCGICAERCPAGAIPVANPSETRKELCISCMRCIQVCPSHARELNKVLLAAASLKLKKECSGRKENKLFL